MRGAFIRCTLFGGVVILALARLPVPSACGAAILEFRSSLNDPPVLISAGGTFSVAVNVVTTLDSGATIPTQVNGLDYQIQSMLGSTPTSNLMQFVSRTTDPNSPFNGPIVDDSALSPVTLHPMNGVDLGADELSGGATTSAATYPVATLTIKVLSTTPTGSYRLGFTSADYTGAFPYNQYNFNALGALLVDVGPPERSPTRFGKPTLGQEGATAFTSNSPEPASIALAGLAGMLGMSRRARRLGQRRA